jgi:hypothetical protein
MYHAPVRQRAPLRPVTTRPRRRATAPPRAESAAAAPYADLKSAASAAHARAAELLPRLEEASAAAERAAGPAAEADARWRDAHARTHEVQAEATELVRALRAGALEALRGGDAAASELLHAHLRARLADYREHLAVAGQLEQWHVWSADVQRLEWLPGAALGHALGAAVVDGRPFAVAAVAVAAPPLDQDLGLRSLFLHWGPAEGSGGRWIATVPEGWHTSPSVSQPRGATAWETALALHAPVMSGATGGAAGGLASAPAFSTVLQIPLEGVFAAGGGVKFVVRRADGGQPEWVKPGHNADWFVDFSPATRLFAAQRDAAAAAATAAALGAAAGGDEESLAAANSLDEWGWARALGSGDEEEDGSDARAEGPASALGGVAAALPPARALPPPAGWLAAVDKWRQVPDYPPPTPPSFSAGLEDLRAILAAEAAAGGLAPAEAEAAAALLRRADAAGATLAAYDAASLAARGAQAEREALGAAHKASADEAAHLHAEVAAALDAARRGAVALRGRAAEISPRDLGALAAQLAHESAAAAAGRGAGALLGSLFGGGGESGTGSRRLVFISQEVAAIGGGAGDATLVAQVYLEGDRAAVDAALTPRPPAAEVEAAAEAAAAGAADAALAAAAAAAAAAALDPDARIAAAEAAAAAAAAAAPPPPPPPPPPLPFDMVVIAFAAGEAFPEGRIAAPAHLHLGLVPHAGAKWQAPPDGFAADPPPAPGGAADALPWVPLQRFAIARADGSPALVDPVAHGAVARLPLLGAGGLAARGLRGVELVLKGADERWMGPADGSRRGTANFYVELPLPAPGR